jgi:hypothetical protein
MQKAFGILCIVVGIWVGLEVYQNGMSGAFDGLFVRFGMAEAQAPDAGPYQTPGERAGERLKSAYQAGMDRGDRPELAEGGGRQGGPGERTAARLRGMAGRD